MADISTISVDGETTDINKINLNGTEYNLVKGSSVTYRTEEFSQSKYGSSWTWVNFDFTVPSGTVGIISVTGGGMQGYQWLKYENGHVTVSAFTGDTGRTLSITIVVLIQE